MKRVSVRLICSGIILLWALAVRSDAATNTVTSTADSGAGSLRQTVIDSVSGDTIDFGVMLPATITLTTGEIALDKDLTIEGPGADELSVSGNADGRIFNVASNATVALAGLSLVSGLDTNGTGGAILNAGTLSITECALSGNQAGAGGPCTGGGAIYNAATGTLTIDKSTLDNNIATGGAGTESGGALLNGGGTVTITTSTLAANSTTGEDGGGGAIFNDAGGSITIANSTIASNSTAGVGGGVYNLDGEVEVTSTIIAINTADGSDPDVAGEFLSGGFNVIGDYSLNAIGFDDDLFGFEGEELDPMLGPLQNNGGPTATMELLPGSPAISAGDCEDPSEDQRGELRPVGPACDSGAFEVQECTDPISITCPGDVTAAAFLPTGARINFDDPEITTMCPGASFEFDPPSGSDFEIGTTEVTCYALDASQTRQASCTFNVTVTGPEDELANAIAIIQSLGLDPRLERALIRKVQQAAKRLASGKISKVCHPLTALFRKASREVGQNRLSTDDANMILVPITRVRGVAGCYQY